MSILATTSTYTTSASIWSTGNVTINSGGTSGSYLYTTGSGLNNWGSITNSNLTGAGLHVTSDANIEGDLKVKGVSISETLDKINKRLAILVPDPKKLEHFEALKKAYDHYKVLEALCQTPEKKNDNS
jgi:hypothetical protein